MRFSDHPYSLDIWRRTNLRIFRRAISVLMVLTFVFPSLSWAFEPVMHPDAVLYHGQELRISERLGHLKEAYQGTAGPMVVYIQDLHCNYEVQSHISEIIRQLAQEQGLKLVASEGATGEVDSSPLSSFTSAWVKHEVGCYLMRQGKMTGTEFYAATGKQPVRLVGIESEALYEKNLSSALRILSYESQGYVLDLREALDRLKPGIYSPALLKWDEVRIAFRDGRKSLREYASALCRQAARQGLDLKRFPNLGRYALAGKDGADIDNDSLLREIDGLEAAVRDALYSRAAERQLDDLQARLAVVEKLMAISATAEELQQFRTRPMDYRAEVFITYIRQHSAEVADDLDPETTSLNQWLDEALKFYQIADERSQAFVQNTLAAMQQQGTDLALMVTGGYHTPEILAAMKKQGISYVCVQPVLLRQDVANPYLSILSGKQSPLEKFLAKNQNILSPRLAFSDAQHLDLLKRSLAVLCGGATLVQAVTQGAHSMAMLHTNYQAETDVRLQALAPQWAAGFADEAHSAFLVPMAGDDIAILIRQQDRVLRHPASLAEMTLAGYEVELLGLDQVGEAKALLEAEGRALTVRGLDVQAALLASPLAALVGLSGTLAVAPTEGQQWLGKAGQVIGQIQASLKSAVASGRQQPGARLFVSYLSRSANAVRTAYAAVIGLGVERMLDEAEAALLREKPAAVSAWLARLAQRLSRSVPGRLALAAIFYIGSSVLLPLVLVIDLIGSPVIALVEAVRVWGLFKQGTVRASLLAAVLEFPFAFGRGLRTMVTIRGLATITPVAGIVAGAAGISQAAAPTDGMTTVYQADANVVKLDFEPDIKGVSRDFTPFYIGGSVSGQENGGGLAIGAGYMNGIYHPGRDFGMIKGGLSLGLPMVYSSDRFTFPAAALSETGGYIHRFDYSQRLGLALGLWQSALKGGLDLSQAFAQPDFMAESSVGALLRYRLTDQTRLLLGGTAEWDLVQNAYEPWSLGFLPLTQRAWLALQYGPESQIGVKLTHQPVGDTINLNWIQTVSSGINIKVGLEVQTPGALQSHQGWNATTGIEFTKHSDYDDFNSRIGLFAGYGRSGQSNDIQNFSAGLSIAFDEAGDGRHMRGNAMSGQGRIQEFKNDYTAASAPGSFTVSYPKQGQLQINADKNQVKTTQDFINLWNAVSQDPMMQRATDRERVDAVVRLAKDLGMQSDIVVGRIREPKGQRIVPMIITPDGPVVIFDRQGVEMAKTSDPLAAASAPKRYGWDKAQRPAGADEENFEYVIYGPDGKALAFRYSPLAGRMAVNEGRTSSEQLHGHLGDVFNDYDAGQHIQEYREEGRSWRERLGDAGWFKRFGAELEQDVAQGKLATLETQAVTDFLFDHSADPKYQSLALQIAQQALGKLAPGKVPDNRTIDFISAHDQDKAFSELAYKTARLLLADAKTGKAWKQERLENFLRQFQAIPERAVGLWQDVLASPLSLENVGTLRRNFQNNSKFAELLKTVDAENQIDQLYETKRFEENYPVNDPVAIHKKLKQFLTSGNVPVEDEKPLARLLESDNPAIALQAARVFENSHTTIPRAFFEKWAPTFTGILAGRKADSFTKLDKEVILEMMIVITHSATPVTTEFLATFLTAHRTLEPFDAGLEPVLVLLARAQKLKFPQIPVNWLILDVASQREAEPNLSHSTFLDILREQPEALVPELKAMDVYSLAVSSDPEKLKNNALVRELSSALLMDDLKHSTDSFDGTYNDNFVEEYYAYALKNLVKADFARTHENPPADLDQIAMALLHLTRTYASELQGKPAAEQLAFARRAVKLIVEERARVSQNGGTLIGPGQRLVVVNNSQGRFNPVEHRAIARYFGATVMENIKGTPGVGGAQQVKQNYFRMLRQVASQTNKPTTVFHDGHGGPSHFWLSNGEVGHEVSDELQHPLAISYREIAENLVNAQMNAKKGALPSKVDLSHLTLIFDACYQYDMVKKILDDEFQRLAAEKNIEIVPANIIPVSLPGRVGFGMLKATLMAIAGKKEKGFEWLGVAIEKANLKIEKGKPFQLGNVLDASKLIRDEHISGPQLFVPIDPAKVRQELQLPETARVKGYLEISQSDKPALDGHGYGAAAARASRNLQWVAGVVLPALLALLAAPAVDLAQGNWVGFAWKTATIILAALLPLISALVAQNRLVILRQYMPRGDIAASAGDLDPAQVAALAKLKYSDHPAEQALYQAILLHESYRSHFYGTLVMNPIFGWLFRLLHSPDNFETIQGQTRLRGDGIDQAVAGLHNNASPVRNTPAGSGVGYLWTALGLTGLLFGIIYPYLIDWRHTWIFYGLANTVVTFILNFFIINQWLAKLMHLIKKPIILPGLEMKEGITKAEKTIAYYPILFSNEAALNAFEETMVPSIADNQDPNILWVILSTSPENIRQLEERKIMELQKRFGADRVFYFHRDASQENWERKRGGYMQFMLWQQQGCAQDGSVKIEARFPGLPGGKVFDQMMGNLALLKDAKNMVVGDSDTYWPSLSIHKLIGKIAHPKNREYVIFQSRSLPFNYNESYLTRMRDAVARLFGDQNDTWRQFGEVFWIGFGAGWNIAEFLDSVQGKIADGFVSHDYVESLFARTAFVQDVTVFEEISSNYELLTKQWTRYWKGDKRTWVFYKTHIPVEGNRTIRNPLSSVQLFYLLKDVHKQWLVSLFMIAFMATAGHVQFVAGAMWLSYLFFSMMAMLILVWNKGWRKFFESLLIFPINSIEIPIFMMLLPFIALRDYAQSVYSKLVSKRLGNFVWIPQGDLSREFSFRSALPFVGFTLTIAAFGVWLTPTLYSFPIFGPFLFAPLTIWIVAQKPKTTASGTRSPAVERRIAVARSRDLGIGNENQNDSFLHGYGVAAARISRNLQWAASVVMPILLALLAAPAVDLAQGNWAGFVWKAATVVLAALLPMISALVAQNRLAILRQYMPRGDIAASAGDLDPAQVAALAKLKYSDRPAEQALYQAIILHESYRSHFYGTLVMNPIFGWLFRLLHSPDNFETIQGQARLRGDGIDQAVVSLHNAIPAQSTRVNLGLEKTNNYVLNFSASPARSFIAWPNVLAAFRGLASRVAGEWAALRMPSTRSAVLHTAGFISLFGLGAALAVVAMVWAGPLAGPVGQWGVNAVGFLASHSGLLIVPAFYFGLRLLSQIPWNLAGVPALAYSVVTTIHQVSAAFLRGAGIVLAGLAALIPGLLTVGPLRGERTGRQGVWFRWFSILAAGFAISGTPKTSQAQTAPAGMTTVYQADANIVKLDFEPDIKDKDRNFTPFYIGGSISGQEYGGGLVAGAGYMNGFYHPARDLGMIKGGLSLGLSAYTSDRFALPAAVLSETGGYIHRYDFNQRLGLVLGLWQTALKGGLDLSQAFTQPDFIAEGAMGALLRYRLTDETRLLVGATAEFDVLQNAYDLSLGFLPLTQRAWLALQWGPHSQVGVKLTHQPVGETINLNIAQEISSITSVKFGLEVQTPGALQSHKGWTATTGIDFNNERVESGDNVISHIGLFFGYGRSGQGGDIGNFTGGLSMAFDETGGGRKARVDALSGQGRIQNFKHDYTALSTPAAFTVTYPKQGQLLINVDKAQVTTTQEFISLWTAVSQDPMMQKASDRERADAVMRLAKDLGIQGDIVVGRIRERKNQRIVPMLITPDGPVVIFDHQGVEWAKTADPLAAASTQKEYSWDLSQKPRQGDEENFEYVLYGPDGKAMAVRYSPLAARMGVNEGRTTGEQLAGNMGQLFDNDFHTSIKDNYRVFKPEDSAETHRKLKTVIMDGVPIEREALEAALESDDPAVALQAARAWDKTMGQVPEHFFKKWDVKTGGAIQAHKNDVQPVTDNTFEAEVLRSAVPVVVDFYADWCGPCRMQAPVLEELSADYQGRVKVVKINSDDNSAMSGKFDVTGLPTMLIFNAGQVQERVVGYTALAELKSRLEPILNKPGQSAKAANPAAAKPSGAEAERGRALDVSTIHSLLRLVETKSVPVTSEFLASFFAPGHEPDYEILQSIIQLSSAQKIPFPRIPRNWLNYAFSRQEYGGLDNVATQLLIELRAHPEIAIAELAGMDPYTLAVSSDSNEPYFEEIYAHALINLSKQDLMNRQVPVPKDLSVIQMPVLRLLRNTAPQLKGRSLPEQMVFVQQAIQLIQTERERFADQVLVGPGRRLAGVFHQEPRFDPERLRDAAAYFGSEMTDNNIVKGGTAEAKENYFKMISRLAAETGQPTTIWHDGHGGKAEFYLTPSQSVDYDEVAEHLVAGQADRSAVDLSHLTLVFDACYSYDMARKILDEAFQKIARSKNITITPPAIIVTASAGRVGYGDLYEALTSYAHPWGSSDIAKGTPFKIRDFYKFDAAHQTHVTEPALFIPVDPGKVRQNLGLPPSVTVPRHLEISQQTSTMGGHGYGVAALRISRNLQLAAAVVLPVLLAILAAPLVDLAQGHWGAFVWKTGIFILAALLPLISALVAQNRLAILRQYMPRGDIAISHGALSQTQLEALARLKNSPWSVEQRLYQLILLHESYRSHFYGTLVMNPIFGWVFQRLRQPDNLETIADQAVLRSAVIDQAVGQYQQQAQTTSEGAGEQSAEAPRVSPETPGESESIRWNEPILYQLPGWLRFRLILGLGLFFQGLRFHPFRNPGALQAPMTSSSAIREILNSVVPQIPAEIWRTGQARILPVYGTLPSADGRGWHLARASWKELFLGSHNYSRKSGLVIYLPGYILQALVRGESTQATADDLRQFAQAKEMAQMMAAYQVRRYTQETAGVTQQTVASRNAYATLDQDLTAKLEPDQPTAWKRGTRIGEKEAAAQRLQAEQINITRTELAAYFRELMRDVEQAAGTIQVPDNILKTETLAFINGRKSDDVSRGREQLKSALKARLAAGEDITADALLNLLEKAEAEADVQVTLLRIQLQEARKALAGAKTPEEFRRLEQALHTLESGILYNMIGLLAESRPELEPADAQWLSEIQPKQVRVESLSKEERREIRQALDRAQQYINLSNDPARKAALGKRITALNNAVRQGLDGFVEMTKTESKNTLVQGVIAARLALAGTVVEVSDAAAHMETISGARVYLAAAGQREMPAAQGVVSVPMVLEVSTKAGLDQVHAQIVQGIVQVENGGHVSPFIQKAETPAAVKETPVNRGLGKLLQTVAALFRIMDVIFPARVIRLPQITARISFWLQEKAYQQAPSLVLAQAIRGLKKSMPEVLRESRLNPYLPADNQSMTDYLNSQDPLPIALRALALHPSPQTRDQVTKTLLRIIRPEQQNAWTQEAALAANTSDWLVFSAFIGGMDCIPSVDIATPNQTHKVWNLSGFDKLKDVKLAVPAVLLNLQGTRGWLGFVTDRLSHPDSPFEVHQDVIDMFLRRGLMRFSSAA